MLGRDDVAAFFLRNLTPFTRKDHLKRRSRFPLGQFRCIKFKISSPQAILDLFEGAGVNFVLRKYYASVSGIDRTLVPLDGPLPQLTSDQIDQLVRSDSAPRHTHNIYWLACDASKKAPLQQSLVIVWWPTLLPQSRTGELCFKFSYVHVEDGVRIRGEHRRPLPPPVTDPLACARWKIAPPTNADSLRLRFVKFA